MRDGVGDAVGRDHDRRDTRAGGERQAERIQFADFRGLVVVEAIGLIIGDDDHAVLPVGAAHDGVDLVGEQRLADLGVRIAGMVVVAREGGADRGARTGGQQSVVVVVAAADVEYARLDGVRRHGGEEVAQAVQVRQLHRVVADVAEILRGVVMGDVAGVGRRTGTVGRLVIVAFLVPAPVHRLLGGDGVDVALDVDEVEGRILVRDDRLVDRLAHERQRQAGVGLGEVRAGGADVVRAERRLDGREVVVGARERRGVAAHRFAAARGDLGIGGVAGRFARVQDPLGFAHLAGDQGDGVRRRWTVDGHVEVVEQGEAVGVGPQHRDGVAVDVGDEQFTLLLRGERRRRGGGHRHAGLGDHIAHRVGREAFGIEHEAVVEGHAADAADDVIVVDDAGMGVVDRGGVGGIEIDRGRAARGADALDGLGNQERRDRAHAPIGVDDLLDEAGDRGVGRQVSGRRAGREQAVGARIGAEVVVEGPVLLEQHEHVLHLLLEKRKLFGVIEEGDAPRIADILANHGAGARGDGELRPGVGQRRQRLQHGDERDHRSRGLEEFRTVHDPLMCHG